MFATLKKLIVGDVSEKTVRRHMQTVARINALEPEFERLTDAQLAHKTVEFRQRLESGESLDDLLPEAFAAVREAAKRTLGQRHFDVQLVGGMVLHEGNVAEMKTGEGKTLVATLPAYLNALPGQGVHVVTVNDYLARRDAEWMGQIYKFLGLRVGLIVHGLNPAQRRESYQADITYGTNNEFGFDYLRDNMAISLNDLVQRPLNYAIVDEADSILIDEARTPLIISGPAEKPTELYYTFAKLVTRLQRDVDYTVDEKERRVAPTEEGIAKVEKMLNVKNLVDENAELYHYFLNALKAKELFHRDRDYVVKDGQVIIVDEFTGRLMFGRRWSDGLHQAVEAKEGVKIERETLTLATITIQNYFRMYRKLAGMTGTAKTEEQEFRQIYGMDVIVVPTNKPMIRKDLPDVVYKTVRAKFNAVVEEIVERHKTGQPVLVGTVSIEKSEMLSEMLKRRGIPHQVLNAKYHEKEAEIVAQAGRFGAVTIATNMAGRGTDILLGGNPAFMARDRLRREGYDAGLIARATEGLPSDDPEIRKLQELYRSYYEEFKKQCDAEAEKVKAAGGLHIIGTERHEARRIDNQLRGRAGRQGDPGSSRFYVALEDDLMRLFGGEMVASLMEKLGLEEDVPIDHPMVSRAIENAQKKVEARNFEIRKHVLQYDQVLNEQRDLIYKQRRQVLRGENLRESALDAIHKVCERLVQHYGPETHPEEWDPQPLIDAAHEAFFPAGVLKPEDLRGLRKPELAERLKAVAEELYAAKEARIGPELMRELERAVFLRTVDEKWIEHLTAMDDLREGIGLRAYAQRDPLIEYKLEGMDMFNAMIESIQETVAQHLFRLEIVRQEVHPAPSVAPGGAPGAVPGAGGVATGAPGEAAGPGLPAGGRPGRPVALPPALEFKRRVTFESGPGAEARPQAPARAAKAVGRNDPCPCGSGKKYKKCCGRTAAQGA
ncbi:preprotein translocase subunit SecA [Caldinitratiruptor microaerophilus]|uniref:Protein translocase subunit SecA n=1 Tax=Caldinitratiruptor microaerophilus TaxID=671077 RepID=A0AA35CM78_9FIRM|nr:preprotein translocase subunit SecA [Caldinitratiruptor microaerophilus]BDG61717.1 protein translocase subunit SecA [Caldinitratiruptor microaerophilus]